MEKVALVTGGSRGIGAATSRLLATQGYSVCINYRSGKETADALVAELKQTGADVFACQADVSQEQDVVALFRAVREKFGPVTHLVNNAGILFKQAGINDISTDRFNTIMTTNVTSCFLCSKEALKSMDEGCSIVNVSSAAARTGAPFEYVDYAASKGAMDSLTKGISLEVADKGIRVNGVRPGFIYTDMHADGGEPGRVDRLAPNIPLKRGGTPEEVANAIAWLLSDEASYVTGTFIDLAGGK